MVVENYGTAPSLSAAARAADVHPALCYRWKAEDDEFAQALAAARIQFPDHLRDLAMTRATGIERPVIHKGELMYRRYPPGHEIDGVHVGGQIMLDDEFEPIVLTETVYSDRMLEKLMEGNVREQARPGAQVAVTNEDGSGGKTTTVVNFVQPPDWDNVEWGEDGRPILGDPLED